MHYYDTLSIIFHLIYIIVKYYLFYSQSFDAKAMMEELAELKNTIKTQDQKIASLESRIASLEGAENGDE